MVAVHLTLNIHLSTPQVVILSAKLLNIGLRGLPRRISNSDLASSLTLEIPRVDEHCPWLLATHSG
jgi:hypothetical protein